MLSAGKTETYDEASLPVSRTSRQGDFPEVTSGHFRTVQPVNRINHYSYELRNPIKSSSSSQLVTPPVIYPVGTSGPTSGHPQISDPMPLIYNSMGNSIPPDDLDGQYQTIEPTSVTSVNHPPNHTTVGLNLSSEPEVSIVSQPKVITPGYLETHRVSKSKGELGSTWGHFEMSSKCS